SGSFQELLPMIEPNWNHAQDVVVTKSQEAIARFATEHPKELCSFFALGVDYLSGDMAIDFDTLENSLTQAKRHQRQVVKDWSATFGPPNREAAALLAMAGAKEPRAWEEPRHYFERESSKIIDHSPSAGYFKYQNFARVEFPEWEQYFSSDDVPDKPDPERHVILLLYRALEKLVESNAFAKLSMASPFRVGFELADDNLGLVVTRILNWPS